MDIPKEIEVVADSEMIKTVIRNLLSNAIKFTPEHGKISVSASKNQEFDQIEISDTGTGMERETLNALFTSGKTETFRKLKILVAEYDEVSEMSIDNYINSFAREILKDFPVF